MGPRALAATAAVAVLGAAGAAQSYEQLTTTRGRGSPYATVLQVRGGLLGSLAGSEDPAVGLDDQLGWDGFVYYRQDRFADRESTLDVYAGRDGAYLGVTEGTLIGEGTQTRLEVSTRYFPFYREGFYRDGDFIPTGRYEGWDWGPQFSAAHMLAEGLRLEVAGFYRGMSFDANENTAPNYVIPDDFNAWGARVFLEQSTLEFDRLDGRPRQGFVLTLIGEREVNDSDREFGTIGVFQSRLPSGLWRGRGRLEWYFPQTTSTTWDLLLNAQLTDELDRVYNYDAQKPQGNFWIDGTLGFRIDVGSAFAVRPFGQVQFVRILDESGVSSDSETFFGGGLNAVCDIGDAMSVLGEYSYLSNESRPPVSTSEDTFGEHRFFLGLELRFGAEQR